MYQLILNYTLRAASQKGICIFVQFYFADRCGILHGSHAQEGSEVIHIVHCNRRWTNTFKVKESGEYTHNRALFLP
jgi:hypothetical protein